MSSHEHRLRKYHKTRVLIVSDAEGEVTDCFVVTSALDIEHAARQVLGASVVCQEANETLDELLAELKRRDALDATTQDGRHVSFVIVEPSELPGEPGDECDVDG